jgi:hypothetical protein
MKKVFLKCLVVFFSFILISLNISASSGSKYLFTGGFPSSNIQDLKFVISGGNNSYQKNIISAGAKAWNDISSKVKISNNSTGAKVSIYKTSGKLSRVYGSTCAYYSTFYGIAYDFSNAQIWNCVDIYGYDNQMDTAGYTDSDKKCIYMHEMGHALSLAHNDSNTFIIMNPSASNIISALYPRNDDKNNLKLKWGY